MAAGDDVRRGPADRAVLGRALAIAVISAEKAASAVGIWALAALALFLHHRAHLHPFQILLWENLGLNARYAIIRYAVRHLPPLGPRLFLVVGFGLIAWGALLGAEAVGLWFQLGWGELLVMVETGALIPVEAWHLARRPHPSSAVALIINVAIFVYVLVLYGRRVRARAPGQSYARHLLGGLPPATPETEPMRARATEHER